MVRMNIPGTVYRRPNGKFQALGPFVHDPTQGKWVRPNLGVHDTEDEANDALLRFHDEKNAGGSVLTALDVRSTLVRQYLKEWLTLVQGQVESGQLARRTATGYESAIRLHIAPALGHLKVADLNHLVIHRWLVTLGQDKGLADRTILRIYRTLHRAMADSPLPENPAMLPKHLRPRVRKEKRTYRPTVDEIRCFLVHVGGCRVSTYLGPMWRLAAATGMRRGELVAVTWSDIDFDLGRLQVDRMIGMDSDDVFVKGPKSDAGR